MCNDNSLRHCLIISSSFDNTFQIKTCSRDPAPPPYEYVKGGGGIFNDMAVHDLDMVSCFHYILIHIFSG
jgi:predicted dehydrogenase